jgi:hypothetical protein
LKNLILAVHDLFNNRHSSMISIHWCRADD